MTLKMTLHDLVSYVRVKKMDLGNEVDRSFIISYRHNKTAINI